MDDLEELVEKGDGVNFIPCIKWVQRGVAKAQPEKIKLTQEELAKVISKTENSLKSLEEPEEEEAEEQEDIEAPKEEQEQNGERDIVKLYGLDTYDDEEEDDTTAGLAGMLAFTNPRDDPYLKNPDEDDDQSDIEDMVIKPTDNLILVGHVEGNAAILEVYVYNDEEDALYVHHDILLPSYPMALEWLNFDPGEETRGNMVAIGSMSPIIDVWDLDVVDSLEPAFTLGQKGSKKRKIPRIGHKDAVLALAWNRNVDHLLASGSVDQTVKIWDMREGKVAKTMTDHKEKVQALSWHPFETQMLLTGCCDQKVRVFDCNQNACKTWSVQGEVEKVLWNPFDPFTFLAATDKGNVHLFDARQDKKALWTLSAHSEGINGMSLSSQCPNCLITGSSDKTVKVWDISDNKPTCVLEKDVKIGMVHSLDGCPDAPFVIGCGGDVPSNNLHVMDIREAGSVRARFGQRKLANPLGYAAFPYSSMDDAEESLKTNEEDQDMQVDASEVAAQALEKMAVTSSSSGGAVGKFKKKDKKKKPKKKF